MKIKKGINKIKIDCGKIHWQGYARNENTAFRRAVKEAFPHEKLFAPLARFKINGSQWFYQEPEALLKN